MLWMLLASALAQSPATAAERLDEAWRRIDVGDWYGARILVDETRALEPSWDEELLYITAVTYQLDREHDEALEVFDALLDAYPEGERAVDTRFRRALTLADRGDFDDASKTLRELRPYGKLPDEGQRKIALCEATWTLERGKKSGLRKIDRELSRLAPEQLTWFQARARSALLHHAVDVSRTLEFDVSDKVMTRQLNTRAAYVFGAEAQLNAIVDTKETWFILDGLGALGDAYVDLADDLLARPVPDDYGDIQTAQFRNRLESQAVVQLIKARKYYDLGREHATRIGWQGPQAEQFTRIVANLDARIESLEP